MPLVCCPAKSRSNTRIATILLFHRLFGVFQEAMQAIARSASNASAE